jgi:hypothetical protein
MTKDEAQEAWDTYLHGKTRLWDGGVRDRQSFRELDIFVETYGNKRAQAAVDAFKTDTLGLLEALAGQTSALLFLSTTVSLAAEWDGTALRYVFRDQLAPDRILDITRAEVEALLGEQV